MEKVDDADVCADVKAIREAMNCRRAPFCLRSTKEDFYRVRVVDELGQVIHERPYAVEIGEDGSRSSRHRSATPPGLAGTS